jgi:hypothetical protein
MAEITRLGELNYLRPFPFIRGANFTSLDSNPEGIRPLAVNAYAISTEPLPRKLGGRKTFTCSTPTKHPCGSA